MVECRVIMCGAIGMEGRTGPPETKKSRKVKREDESS